MKHFIKSLLFITVFIIVGFFGAGYASAQQTVFLDTTFDPGTGLAGGSPSNGMIQPDGKLLIPGTFTTYNGTTVGRIVRINTDGTLDTSFNTNLGTGANAQVFNTEVQSDGKIVITGTFSTVNGIARPGIARLNSDGSVDTSFNATAITAGNNFYHTSTQPDGKIVMVGNYSLTVSGTTYNRIMRFNSDGSLDTTFTTSITGGSKRFTRPP
jgi:uncharacterized delta-60 repeat protein